MSVLRIHKTKNYTVMSNYHLREKDMSFKAKGLMSVMLSLPEDWDYSVAGLATLASDGKDSVISALKELEKFGYLVRSQIVDEKGRFVQVAYNIYEEPQQVSPYAENPNTGFPNAEKPTQLNTKELNTNKINKVSKEESKKSKPEKRAKENVISFNQLIDNYTPNEQLRKELKEHLKVRKNKKAALTNRAIELSLKKLDDLASNDSEKIQMVQNAIMSGWTTFYPLKADEKQKMGGNASYDIRRYEKSANVFESMNEYSMRLSEFTKNAESKSRKNLIDLELTQ